MIAAGLTYDAANRSELRGFGERVVGVGSGVKSLKVRNIIFAQFNDFVGNGSSLGQDTAGLTGASIVVDNSLFRPDPFSNVTITGDGGGLYFELDGDSVLTITDSTFSNYVATNGGAIAVRLRGNSRLIIISSRFENNSVSGAGGAIRVILESGSVTIMGSQFTGNSATVGGRDIRIEGPASLAAAATTKPSVYLIGNSYSGADSVLVSGVVDVFTQQVALPIVKR
jgi:hypothetical protein